MTNELKVVIDKWVQDLGPEATRKCETSPEIAHIMEGDYSIVFIPKDNYQDHNAF